MEACSDKIRLTYFYRLRITIIYSLHSKVFEESMINFNIHYNIDAHDMKTYDNVPNSCLKTMAGEFWRILRKYKLLLYWNIDHLKQLTKKQWKQVIDDNVLMKHFKSDLETMKSSSSTYQFYNINKAVLLTLKPYQVIKELNYVSKYNYVIGYKWLIRVWSGQIPFNWRSNHKRKYQKCIWCDRPWTHFLAHVFIHCNVLKIYRIKHNLSS